jgi:hypothetical protein
MQPGLTRHLEDIPCELFFVNDKGPRAVPTLLNTACSFVAFTSSLATWLQPPSNFSLTKAREIVIKTKVY